MEAPTYTVEEWLQTYTRESSRRTNKFGLGKFLEVMEMRPDDLKQLEGFQIRNVLLNFQTKMIENGSAANSVRAYISAVRNYCDYFGKPIPKSKRIVKAETARGYHVFSNGDLEIMFTYASTQMKAFIATMTSTGWSITDVLHLPRQRIETKLKKNKDGFIFFEWTRRKQGLQASVC